MARTVDKLEAFGEMLKEHKVTVSDQILFYTACYNHFNQEPDRMSDEMRDEMIRKTFEAVSEMREGAFVTKQDLAKTVGVDTKNRSHMSTFGKFIAESQLMQIRSASPEGYVKISAPSNDGQKEEAAD